ncbi:MAG: CPBP family intramembrane glutamic endopeptidase [Ardenticatenales bacterium]
MSLAGPASVPFSGWRTYFRLSRSPVYGVLAALPLLALYDVLIALANRGRPITVRNGAEMLLGRALAAIGAPAALGLTSLIVVLGTLFVVREQRRSPVPIERRILAWMLGESALWAVLIGPVIGAVTAILLSPLADPTRVGAAGMARAAGHAVPLALSAQAAGGAVAAGPIARIALSLGAGLYEELVFRVLLVTAIAWAVRTWGRTGPRGALAVAVAGSALLFSLAHYRPFNPAGETFGVVTFVYRFVAGLAFSAIYAGRGFGVAAWTHALYDVWVVVG